MPIRQNSSGNLALTGSESLIHLGKDQYLHAEQIRAIIGMKQEKLLTLKEMSSTTKSQQSVSCLRNQDILILKVIKKVD